MALALRSAFPVIFNLYIMLPLPILPEGWRFVIPVILFGPILKVLQACDIIFNFEYFMKSSYGLY